MTGEAGPAVLVRGLAVSFAGRAVLRGVDLEAPAGGITVVAGPSGSGKTTLLRAVNRLNELFPGCATEGEVRVRLGGVLRDVRADGLAPEELRRRAALVFQHPLVLPGSVLRNFSVPLRAVLGLGRREVAARAEARLREAGLWEEVRDRLGAPAADLSGGQQQRLCLARALALEPDLLLLDEPTANLDARSAGLVEDLLLGLRGRVPVLAVTHSMEQARRLADRIVHLRDGRVEGTEGPGGPAAPVPPPRC